jgi:hypothetical protein
LSVLTSLQALHLRTEGRVGGLQFLDPLLQALNQAQKLGRIQELNASLLAHRT